MKSKPMPDEFAGFIVTQRVGPTGSSGLNIKLLQDLNRKGQAILAKDVASDRPFFGFLRRGRDSVEKDIRIEKSHDR